MNPKVANAGGAAAITTILCWLISLAGVAVPAEVQGAITTALVFIVGYFTPYTPAKPGKHVAK